MYVTNLIAVLVVRTSFEGMWGLRRRPAANIPVATTAAAAPIAGPVASAARMIET